MLRRIMTVAMVAALSVAVVACNSSDTTDPVTTGDTAALDVVLSDAFQLVRADGSHATRDEYLANPASIDDFTLSDFDVTQTGGRSWPRST